jgi:hypothetical protein
MIYLGWIRAGWTAWYLRLLISFANIWGTADGDLGTTKCSLAQQNAPQGWAQPNARELNHMVQRGEHNLMLAWQIYDHDNYYHYNWGLDWRLCLNPNVIGLAFARLIGPLVNAKIPMPKFGGGHLNPSVRCKFFCALEVNSLGKDIKPQRQLMIGNETMHYDYSSATFSKGYP